MSLTFSQTQGNGSTLSYPIVAKGGYFKDTDIVVELITIADGTITKQTMDTNYTIENNNVIFKVAPTSNYYVRIRRMTDNESTYSDFTRGNAFGATNLNNSFLHALYQMQQLADGFRPNDFYWKSNTNAGNKKLVNLANGKNPGDAVNYSQIKELITATARTSQYANEAASSATSARTSATAAAASAKAAAASAAEASCSADDILTKLLTVDGPGSGLHADLLDGYTGSELLGLTNSRSGTSSDPNTFNAGYDISNHANTPDSTVDWVIHTIQSHTDTDIRFQIASRADGLPRLFFRSCKSSWSVWTRLDRAVSYRGTRAETGSWSITGLTINVPLYIQCKSTSTATAVVRYRVISGASAGYTSGPGTTWSMAHADGPATPHSCVLIPTSSTVVIEVVVIDTGFSLSAYQ